MPRSFRIAARRMRYDRCVRSAPIVAVLIAGCVTESLHTSGVRLADHEDELVARGSADVEIDEGGTARVSADRNVDVWIHHEQVLSRAHCVSLGISLCVGEDRSVADADVARTVTVRELVTGCRGGQCIAKTLAEKPILVGSRTHVSGEAIARTIGAAGILGATGYCVATCENPVKTIGIAGVLVAALLLWQPLALLAH
jgi:hypothetical protein